MILFKYKNKTYKNYTNLFIQNALKDTGQYKILTEAGTGKNTYQIKTVHYLHIAI